MLRRSAHTALVSSGAQSYGEGAEPFLVELDFSDRGDQAGGMWAPERERRIGSAASDGAASSRG
ncbi:hypothetical protein [Sorangium sp. So ce1000]|uniref:hypothetical protein n=1 Tax=Sorangium sp. So ce1000 TaxID=3133325 RepID=UPI003F6413FB